MDKFLKILKKTLAVGGSVYGLLFLVFYFDLDGKLLYNVYEPWIQKHYDKIKDRRDITKVPYDIPNKE